MAYVVHMLVSGHTTARCSICLLGVCLCCLPVLTWTNLSACGCLLAPLIGITLITRAIRSQHYILSNSYKLVRAPRPLCRCRPPHESHMVQRFQVLCLAHRSHSVLPIHRFRWTPPALSQVTFCQLRSLKLPCSSPLLHFWSVASLLMLPRRPSYQSPPHLWIPPRRLFHTPLPPGLEKYACQHASHGIPVKAAPVRPRLCTAISVTPPQPHVSTTHVGTHPVRSTTSYKRSAASTALAGTHNPVGVDPRAGTGPFPKPRALTLLTAISCIINTVSLFFSGIQDWPAGTPPTLSRLPVESSMRLFFKKPVIMFRTSPISSLRTLAPRTSLSCSTRTPLSLTRWC